MVLADDTLTNVDFLRSVLFQINREVLRQLTHLVQCMESDKMGTLLARPWQQVFSMAGAYHSSCTMSDSIATKCTTVFLLVWKLTLLYQKVQANVKRGFSGYLTVKAITGKKRHTFWNAFGRCYMDKCSFHSQHPFSNKSGRFPETDHLIKELRAKSDKMDTLLVRPWQLVFLMTGAYHSSCTM